MHLLRVVVLALLGCAAAGCGWLIETAQVPGADGGTGDADVPDGEPTDGGCLATPEVCNGADDDCNGVIDDLCVPYACSDGGGCITSCTHDGHCSSGHQCAGGLCSLKRPNGSACISGSECSSGSCVDGVCCDAPCTGICLQCSTPGSNGSCRPIPAGQDPHDECPGNAVCNGTGSCI